MEPNAETTKRAPATVVGTFDLSLLLDPNGINHVVTVQPRSSSPKVAREIPLAVGALLFAQQQFRTINDPSRLAAVAKFADTTALSRAGRLDQPMAPVSARTAATYHVELLANGGFHATVEEKLTGILSDTAGGATAGAVPGQLLATLGEPYRTFYREMLDAVIEPWRERRPLPAESSWSWPIALRRLDQLMRRGVQDLGEPETCLNCRALRPAGFACLHCETAPGERPAASTTATIVAPTSPVTVQKSPPVEPAVPAHQSPAETTGPAVLTPPPAAPMVEPPPELAPVAAIPASPPVAPVASPPVAAPAVAPSGGAPPAPSPVAATPAVPPAAAPALAPSAAQPVASPSAVAPIAAPPVTSDQPPAEREILRARELPVIAPPTVPEPEQHAWPLAGILPRGLALLIDLAIGFVLSFLGAYYGLTKVSLALGWLGPADDPSHFASSALLAFAALYFVLGWTGNETYGMMICRIQVLQESNRKRCGLFHAVGRGVGYGLLLAGAVLVFYVGNSIDNLLVFIPTGTPADDAIRAIIVLVALYVVWLGSGQRILGQPGRQTFGDRVGKTVVVVRQPATGTQRAWAAITGEPGAS